MIVTSTDPGVWVEPIKRAVDKGVLVLTADTDTPDSARLAFFGVDAQGLGLLLGQEVRKIVGDTGKIIIGECVLGPSPHKLREAGFRSAFEGTSVKIVGPFETNCDATQNFNTWQNIYTANQDAVALVGLTAVETASLGKLKQQTKGKFVAASFDPGAAGLPMMIDGYLSVCVGQNPYLSGYLTVQAIAKHFRDGRDIKPGINLFPGEYILPKDAPALIQREGMGKPMTDWYKTFLDQNNLRDFALK
jgi:ABC-type sugar transport system substrate-binding protein